MLKPILLATVLTSASPGPAIEAATADEVIARVRAAAAAIRESESEGLRAVADESGRFVWKDTYVFVVNCAADRVIANARFPERVGGDIKQHTDYAGYRYGLALCETAAKPDGGWVEYCWPRPGADTPRIKSSFVLTVPGTPYQVGAGIYTSNGQGHACPKPGNEPAPDSKQSDN